MAWVDEILEYLKSYEGRDVDILCREKEINTSAKNKNRVLVNALMESYEGKRLLSANLKFQGVNVKTIQLNKNGRPKEAMSFAPINFKHLVEEEWETCEFKKYLLHDFIFFVFQKTGDTNYLKEIFKWDMPAKDLEGEVKDVWEDTKEKLLSGMVVREVGDSKLYLNFKNEASTNICHVRPHGTSGTDVEYLPIPDILTGYIAIPKQSFWFNHSYLTKIVNHN